MKKVFIYCLQDPGGNVGYVGKTHKLNSRLGNHIAESKLNEGKRPVCKWILDLLDKGERPEIKMIEECDEDIWIEREKYWINHYRKTSTTLCNVCDGGLGGYGARDRVYTEEDKKRIVKQTRTARSNFSEEVKAEIWNHIQEGKTLEDLQSMYEGYTRQMNFGVRNGRCWNHITGIAKDAVPMNPRGHHLKGVGRTNK